MSDVADAKPALATLVRAGDTQTEAVAITDFIFMARDVSNAYLVTTDDGDLLVNTGFMDNVDRNVALLLPHRTGQLRHIILTQSHVDHFGGVPGFVEDGTTIIGGPDFCQNWDDMRSLQPFFGPRSGKLWAGTMKRPAVPKPLPDVTPDITVNGRYAFEQGGRRFEVIHTPEGETTDGLTVWMPNERIAFTGNLFGPVFLSIPFLCTVRGDKPRSVRQYLKSLDTVRALRPALLITGHGDAIVGEDRIAADLDRMYAAMSWIRDYTLAGMNAGKTVHQLMREVALPEEIAIGEFHGKVSWAVRTIWDEYAGWVHYEDGTTTLYGIPRSAVNADLAELAGGAGPLAARARMHIDGDRPLEALHLLDIALSAEPANAEALNLRKIAHEMLLAASGGGNLSETMWLKAEVADAERRLATQ